MCKCSTGHRVIHSAQVIATLPAMDVAPEAMHTCFSPAIAWAERFWHSQLDRWLTASAHSLQHAPTLAQRSPFNGPCMMQQTGHANVDVHCLERQPICINDRMSSSGTKTEADGQSKLWVERVVAGATSASQAHPPMLRARNLAIINRYSRHLQQHFNTAIPYRKRLTWR